MKRSFRFFAVWLAVTGLLMGVSFGAGVARGKGAPAESSSGLTAQQVQQMIGGASTGGAQQGQSQPFVAPAGGPPGPGG